MGNGSIGSLIFVRDFQKSLNISLVLYSQCNQFKHPINFKENTIRNVGLKSNIGMWAKPPTIVENYFDYSL